jgi:hypothetical protein
MIVIPRGAEVKFQDAITTALLTAAKIKLFQNDVNPNPNTVIGDLTEATFSGYLAATATWGATFLNSDGKAEADAPSHMFARAAGATSNDIFGYWVEDAAGNLLFAERFAGAPIPMAVVTDAIVLLSRFTFGSEF